MSSFDGVMDVMPLGLVSRLRLMDAAVRDSITEIRIRRCDPIAVIIKNSTFFPDNNGDICDYPSSAAIVAQDKLFDELFYNICEYSVHSNMEHLKRGYITLPCGARVGVASTAVTDSCGVVSVKDVSSLNIRLPSQCIDCSRGVLDSLYINSFPSIIVAGMPNSGKTTFLRDMARLLSSGHNGVYRKVAVIDERNELAAKHNGRFLLDVGVNSDVITGFPKHTAIEIATRSMSPEIIVTDEVSTGAEVDSIMSAFSCGIRFALSVHIGDCHDLFTRTVIQQLLSSGEFEYIVLLDGYTYRPQIIDVTELYDENSWCCYDNPCRPCDGQIYG